jgi:RNase H-like domain found in reverse transcriptase/Integrase zinc binding domain
MIQHSHPSSNDPQVENTPYTFVGKRRYRPVNQRIRPVPATFPEDARVTRQFPEDPLLSLRPLSPNPPEFIPTQKLTRDRLKILKINEEGFLWPEEEKLFIMVFTNNEKALAFEDSERGTLRRDYFSDYIMPVIEHVPWADPQIPIPPAHVEEVVQLIQTKIDTGVYEPSQASYRSSIFCVPKTNGSLRIVIDLRTLNSVSIKDAGLPPSLDPFVEPFSARSIYSGFDLLWGYDARILDPRSRDLTSFQTPLGLYRYCSLPMGYTNSVAEFQKCTSFILQHEIPHNANVMMDDIGIKGPPTRYERPDGSYETIPENSGIRRFVWEHAVVVNRILHRLAHAGATISPRKSQVARPEIVLVGQRVTYEGRLPDMSRVSKIIKWPPPQNTTQVRGFLGLAGTMRIWIEKFSELSRPLVELTRKNVTFEWNERRQEAMDALKQAISNSPALISIDYKSGRPVILSVDTSNIAIGFIISHIDIHNQRRPVRFGSIPINDRESRYSQSKLELFGLYRTLRQCRFHLAGVKNLYIEVDAKYIKDMLNNPDLQPNATLNRWIAGILLFDFTLVHIPATHHKGPDGLSRRPPADNDSDVEDDENDDWFEEAYLTFSKSTPSDDSILREGWNRVHLTQSSRQSEELLWKIYEFLSDLKLPPFSKPSLRKAFFNKVKRYYLKNDKMWKHTSSRPLQVILDPKQRIKILQLSHDKLGHRGVYSTAKTISLRFWWPSYFTDVTRFVRSCHQCQIRSTYKVHIPPTISTPVTLFTKVYIDIMVMPKAQGYRYIVAARDDLSGSAEGRKLKKASARAVAQFIFEELICRYGSISEIVTDNGSEVKGATSELLRRHGIPQIRISPYNSQANGVVERGHFTIREAIIKACDGNISQWPDLVHHAFFADRVTVRKATGFSPYYLLYGVDPVLPLDLFEATYLISGFQKNLSTKELIALRIQQLAKHDKDIDQASQTLHQSRLKSKEEFERRYQKRLWRGEYQSGDLVLVRNSRVEKELDRKTKPRYLGPFEVVRRTKGGSYVLKELDGTISKRGVAAFRLLPYHARDGKPLPPDKLFPEEDSDDSSDDDMDTSG